MRCYHWPRRRCLRKKKKHDSVTDCIGNVAVSRERYFHSLSDYLFLQPSGKPAFHKMIAFWAINDVHVSVYPPCCLWLHQIKRVVNERWRNTESNKMTVEYISVTFSDSHRPWLHKKVDQYFRSSIKRLVEVWSFDLPYIPVYNVTFKS